jgi:integrase
MARRGDGISRRGETWWLDFSHQGKRHYVRLGRLISKSVARELAVAARTRILKGEVGIGGPPAITVQDYATRWLREMATQVAETTLEGYRQMLTYYILPEIGTANLGQLDRKRVRTLLLAQQQRKMSKNTIRLIRATLSVMCADAIEAGYCVTNPAQGLSRRGRSGPGVVTQADRQKEIRPLTREQLAALLAKPTKSTKTGAPMTAAERLLFRLMADTGVRPGEALALKWDDLDAVERTLLVERALSGKKVKGTKTHTRRRVDLSPDLVAALEAWQATGGPVVLAGEVHHLGEPEGAARHARPPSPWIFADASGHPLDRHVVSRRFRRCCRAAGIPKRRLYDLRHTFATHALAAGAPITYVAAQLGHSKPTTTLAYYAHWLPDADRTWAGKLAAYRAQSTTQSLRTESGSGDRSVTR